MTFIEDPFHDKSCEKRMRKSEQLKWIADNFRLKTIADAQHHQHYWIGGVRCQRVPFDPNGLALGKEEQRCPDCGVTDGQYHVPGCIHEECPVCRGEAISCECAYGVRSSSAHPSGSANQDK